mgnify:CR=1 FL=1
MAEYTANAVQTVQANRNVLFTDTTVTSRNNSITHREGSGLINLRGVTNQCRARFKITFGANIAVPATGTAGSISLALAINGEAIDSTTMIVTPAAVSEYFNVGRSLYLDIPCGCCSQISVTNTSTQAVAVQNASIIVERVA